MCAMMLPRKRFFYISSGTQLSETNSTFSAEIQLPNSEEFDRISLMQIAIPISYYVIPTGQNTLEFFEGTTVTTITFVPANYNANSFSVALQAALNAQSPNGYSYTVTYPNSFTQPSTGKFTFSVNTIAQQVGFIFTNNICYNMGFNPDITVNFVKSGLQQVLVSANVLNFVPENTILVHSNLVQDSYTDVLQEVYSNNSVPFQNLTFLNPDPLAYSKKLSSSKLTYATFSLTDEYNQPIFLNGLDVVMTIMVYKEPDFFQKAEGYIKYKTTKDVRESENPMEF